MFVLIKSGTSSKFGHVGSKTSSLNEILEKPCVRSRGHILSPILLKLSQNVCLDKISDEFEMWGQKLGQVCLDKISDEFEIGSCGVKNLVTRSNLRKTLCML